MPYKRPYKTTASGRRKRGSAMGRYKKKGRKSLSKAQEKQVEKIAHKEVQKSSESKYFNVNDMTTVATSPVNSYTSRGWLAVRGYITGNKWSTPTQTTTNWKYGYTNSTTEANMVSLNLNRIFVPTNTDPYKANQCIQGSEVSPSFAQTEWIFERDYIDTTDSGQLDTAPYFIRVIRCKPKPKRGSFQEVDPKNDLFLDQYNQAIGVNTFDFREYELRLFKTNNRNYTILSDKSFYLNPSGTGSIFPIADSNTSVTNLGLKSTYGLRMRHNIGRKLYYADPTATNEEEQLPSDGFVPEFILVHVVPVGVSVNAQGTSAGISAKRMDINVKSVSTFKDL